MVFKAVSSCGHVQAFPEGFPRSPAGKIPQTGVQIHFFKPSEVHALYVNLQKYPLRCYIEGLTFLATASPSSQLVLWECHSKKGYRIRIH